MEIETLVARHLATWSEDDPGRRAAAYGELYDPDVRLVEPSGEGRGHAAVEAAIAGLRAQIPGHAFAVEGAISHHHDAATYRWRLAPPGGDAAATGTDVLLLSGGRIATAYVFVDAPA